MHLAIDWETVLSDRLPDFIETANQLRGHGVKTIAVCCPGSALRIFELHAASNDPAKRKLRQQRIQQHGIASPSLTDDRDLLIKFVPDAFYGMMLARELRNRGITDVILTGGLTKTCVRATALGGLMRGFRMWVMYDCVTECGISPADEKNPDWHKKRLAYIHLQYPLRFHLVNRQQLLAALNPPLPAAPNPRRSSGPRPSLTA